MKHCLIIGSGLGGLSCGALLARHGFAVTVLEQGAQAGGCLQSFVRAGAKFETGMHFVGSADPGQAFRRLLYGFELDELPLERLDPAAYDVITLGRDEFPWANGAEAFVESLASSFPAERDGLHRYMQLVENIAAASPLRAATASDAALQAMMDYRLRSVDEVVDTLVRDPLLRRVLVGNAPLYAGRFGHTPFTSHAFITDFYNRSAFRIVGGSEQMAERLVHSIENRGGRVETRCRVVKIAHDGVRATGVYTADGQFFPADCVIAAVHPRRVLEMLEEGAPFRPAYRRRIAALPQTVGCFTVYLDFLPEKVPYLRSNHYVYPAGNPWHCDEYTAADWPRGYLYMHLCPTAGAKYATTAEIIGYMRYEEVEKWSETRVGRRGEAYEAMKRAKAEQLLAAVEAKFPGTRAAVRRFYTSTPLTYRDYTGTARGSLYGVEQDVALAGANRVQHRTKLPNLFLAGQNINAHGALGTLVGTLVVCKELVEADRLLAPFRE